LRKTGSFGVSNNGYYKVLVIILLRICDTLNKYLQFYGVVFDVIRRF
jgi:hypothetical protein